MKTFYNSESCSTLLNYHQKLKIYQFQDTDRFYSLSSIVDFYSLHGSWRLIKSSQFLFAIHITKVYRSFKYSNIMSASSLCYSSFQNTTFAENRHNSIFKFQQNNSKCQSKYQLYKRVLQARHK